VREKTKIVADKQPRFDVCRSTTNDGQPTPTKGLTEGGDLREAQVDVPQSV